MSAGNFKIESGIQFLARIKNSKRCLKNLDNTLFDEGLGESDLVALSAENTYLKNLMLMHILKKVTLDDSFGGSNSSVLFIDTAFNFQVRNFAACLTRHCNLREDFTDDNRKKLVEKSLENLIFIKCYDSQQLFLTFQTLHTVLSANSKFKLVVLDNVGSNYWQDVCSGGLKRMDLYEKKMLSVLQNCLKDFKLNIVYIRPEFFVQKNPILSLDNTYNIRVTKKECEVKVDVTKKSTSYSRMCTILNGDVCWS